MDFFASPVSAASSASNSREDFPAPSRAAVFDLSGVGRTHSDPWAAGTKTAPLPTAAEWQPRAGLRP
jgi:hypothetical protein